MTEIQHVIGGTLVRLGRVLPPPVFDRTSVRVSRLAGSITPGTKPTPFPGYGAVGSYKPDATTSGVIAGTTLTPRMSTIQATGGQTYENLEVFGRIVVTGPDVTIRNCLIRGDSSTGVFQPMIAATNGNVRRLLIEDVTVKPDNPLTGTSPRRGFDGITGHDYTARRVRVENTIDGFGVFNTNNPSGDMAVTLEACYVNGLTFISPSATNSDNKTHNDCLQIQGGRNITVRGCSFQGFIDQAVSDNGSFTKPRDGVYSNSCIQVTQGVGTVSGCLFEKNWFNGGAISINLGGAYADFGTIRDNRFGRDSREAVLYGGQGALIYNTSSVITLTNNVYDDETPIIPRKGS